MTWPGAAPTLALMCGRATHKLSWADIVRLLRLTVEDAPPSNLEPNYNLAPTEDIFACVEEDGRRRVERMRWGLVPFWAKELPKFGTHNARSDALSKPTWRSLLDKNRTVIVLSGFYEWQKTDGAKQPYLIERRDRMPMLMAGLFSRNERVTPGKRSAAIITCAANKSVARIHDRMPVVLAPESVDLWLRGPWSEDKQKMLTPCPDDWLTACPVSKAVGNVRNKGAEMLTPAGAALF